jgi:hypothetical protein
MLKPPMPNIPSVGAVTDTLDFVKNLWGSMSVPGVTIPGMVAPTVSIDELDKKIADLKAVESWLNVNLSMLHGTIQALEVQRGTIATLKSMGASLAAAVKQPGAGDTSTLASAPFASGFFSPPTAEAAPAPQAEPAQAAAPQASEAAPADAGTPAMPAMNPNLWWNLLQDQFKQAVNTAMSSNAMAGANAMAQDAAAKLSTAATQGPATERAKRPPAKPKTAKPKEGKG